MKFHSSMLREKFVITAPSNNPEEKPLVITAPGTRMPVTLQSGSLPEENLIIRSHNMHSCTRMAGKLLYDYDKRGPILTREPSVKFSDIWDDCLSHYEKMYAKPWIAIYRKGKILFEEGERHPFLDVIEKCDIVNKGDYDSSIALAQKSAKQAGNINTEITYDSAVALVVHLDRSTTRCGMVIRNPDRTNNFNLTIQETGTSGKMNISLGLATAAAFLEGVQLGFFIGIQQAKLRRGLIQRFSLEDKNTREARERLAQLEAEINATENRYTVRYRPERPNFLETIQISERIALKRTAAQQPATAPA